MTAFDDAVEAMVPITWVPHEQSRESAVDDATNALRAALPVIAQALRDAEVGSTDRALYWDTAADFVERLGK